MLAVGDLCHHTEFEIEKDIRWKTDKIEYRNDSFVNKADVLLIGDSFFIGTSLSQDSTITNILREKLRKFLRRIAIIPMTIAYHFSRILTH